MTVSLPETSPLRWAAYCRPHNSASCQAQLAKCLRAPHQIPQLNAAPEASLSDAALSRRTNLTQLLEMARRREIDLLVVSCITRIARSSRSAVQIADALKDAGAGLYSLAEGWLVYPQALNVDSPSSQEAAPRKRLFSHMAIAVAFGIETNAHGSLTK